MALREDRIGQAWLVPKRLTNFIPENNICYFVANLVEKLDLKKSAKNTGTPKVKQRIHVEYYYG